MVATVFLVVIANGMQILCPISHMPIGYGIGVNYKAHSKEANVSDFNIQASSNLSFLTFLCNYTAFCYPISTCLYENTR
jgi:hypothetical protein